jgi:hypothetical protein
MFENNRLISSTRAKLKETRTTEVSVILLTKDINLHAHILNKIS